MPESKQAGLAPEWPGLRPLPPRTDRPGLRDGKSFGETQTRVPSPSHPFWGVGPQVRRSACVNLSSRVCTMGMDTDPHRTVLCATSSAWRLLDSPRVPGSRLLGHVTALAPTCWGPSQRATRCPR